MFHLYTGLRPFRAPVQESRLCLRPVGGFHLRTQRTKGTREPGWKPARDKEEEEEEEERE